MRAWGAAVTDIVVLVVAADDAMMPQTLEAMSHVKAAGVPIVVAVNKYDKPTANLERVRVQLAAEGLPLEEVGGDVQGVEVSDINKTGLYKLEEALLLQAELMDLKVHADGPAQAHVVEARLGRGQGPWAIAIEGYEVDDGMGMLNCSSAFLSLPVHKTVVRAEKCLPQCKTVAVSQSKSK